MSIAYIQRKKVAMWIDLFAANSACLSRKVTPKKAKIIIITSAALTIV
jgi:hypothetical protein